MKIGLVKKDNVPSIPEDLVEKVDGSENISIYSGGTKYRRSDIPADYITTKCAVPHIDETYYDHLFLTLSLTDRVELGGMWLPIKHDSPVMELSRGTFFLIDPSQLHWLFPKQFAVNHTNLYRWWGLQWEIPFNDEVEKNMRCIVESFGAEWKPNQKQYASFMKHKTAQIERME